MTLTDTSTRKSLITVTAVSNSNSGVAEKIPDPFVIDGDVQIHRRDADVGVSRGVAHFGQCSPPGEGVTDKSVPPVVNGECSQSRQSERFARRQEPMSQCVSGECAC